MIKREAVVCRVTAACLKLAGIEFTDAAPQEVEVRVSRLQDCLAGAINSRMPAFQRKDDWESERAEDIVRYRSERDQLLTAKKVYKIRGFLYPVGVYVYVVGGDLSIHYGSREEIRNYICKYYRHVTVIG